MTDGAPTARRDIIIRVLLAGPGAIVSALLLDLGMSLWLPSGAAGIDQIALPLVLLPLIWAALFFHACLDRSLRRAALVALVVCLVNGGAIAWHVAGIKSYMAKETIK